MTQFILSVNILYTIISRYSGGNSRSSVSGFTASICTPHNQFLIIYILYLFSIFINIYNDITLENSDNTSLADWSFGKQMRSKISTYRGQRQIVQEKEDKEEKEVAHPSEFKQLWKMEIVGHIG